MTDELIRRCDMLCRVYGRDAVLCVPEADARAAGLAEWASKPLRHDVPLGSGFTLNMVQISAARALKALRGGRA